MRPVLRWGVGIAVAVLLTLTGAGAATAADVPTTTSAAQVVRAAASDDGPVEGQTWSSPAVPASCSRSGITVTCTPESSSSSVAMSCYLDVALDDTSVTVCASSKDSQTALETAGAKKLDYQWGCAQTWDWCGFMENAAEAISVQAIDAAGHTVSAISFTTKSALWSAAMGQWSFWVWAVWIVILAAGIIGITQAAFTGSFGDVLGAIGRLAVTVPLTQAQLWLMGAICDAVNELTLTLFASSDPFGTIVSLLFSGGQVNPISGAGAALLVLVAVGLLLLVFIVRNVALAALVMVGPIAWMLFPMREIGKQWVNVYLSAFAATLLTGPIMMSLLAFTTSGLKSVSSLWDPAILPFMIGIIIICFAPFAVFGLFSFVGNSVIDGAASGAGHAVRNVSSSVSRQIPSPRLGGAGGGVARGGGSSPSITGGSGRSNPGGSGPGPRSTRPLPSGPAPSGGSSAAPSTRRGARESAPQSAPMPRSGGAARPTGGVGSPPSAYRSAGRRPS